MLLISHDLGIVASACERIYVMYAGRTVEWGTTAAVFETPAHPYTVGLLHAAQADRDSEGRFVTIAGDPPRSPYGCGLPLRPALHPRNGRVQDEHAGPRRPELRRRADGALLAL